MKTTKIHWLDLTDVEKVWYELNSNGCGGSDWQAALLKKLYYGKLFHASCVQHDYNYARGGNLYDKLRADWDMFEYSMDDAFEKRDAVLFLAACAYYLAVSVFGIFYFKWGRYRTKDEILSIA